MVPGAGCIFGLPAGCTRRLHGSQVRPESLCDCPGCPVLRLRLDSRRRPSHNRAMSAFGPPMMRSSIFSMLVLGLLGLGSTAVAFSGPGEMTFRPMVQAECVRDCPVFLVAEGRITDNTYQHFRAAVAATGARRAIVLLNSPGGTLPGGILLGLALREQRALAYVPRGAACESACAYAFLGGVARRVDQGARLGVHRFFAVSAVSGQRSSSALAYERAITPRANALLREYVTTMGASPRLLSVAEAAGPTDMRYLSPAELQHYGVVTRATRQRAARQHARRR